MRSEQPVDSAETAESEATPSAVDHFAMAAAPVWPAWVVAAAICVWLSWNKLPGLYLTAWILIYLVFTAGRIDLFRRYFRAPRNQRTRDEPMWRQRFFLLMMIYGTMQVLLVAPAIAFAPIERAILLTFMMVFSGTLVSSIMPLSKKNLRGYLGLTLGMAAAAWLLTHDGYGWTIALGLVGCGAAFHKTGLARLAAIEQAHQLGLQLAENNALLKQTHATRSRLTMEASHDLRQPVQALTLMADMLRSAKESPTFDTRVRDIEVCAASLADMLSELMEFSRLDLGGYAPSQQAVPIEEVLQELNAVLASAAQSKRLGWRVSALPLIVRSNPWTLRRILLNLATNAVKYTRTGSVSIECRRDGDHLDILVRDTGAGIPEAQQKRIFMEFVRVNESQGGEPGMGIGLAFAKQAADALGHQLTVRSTVGSGTEMILRVALAAEQTAPVRQEPQNAAADDAMSLAGLHVLLMENDPLLQRSMVDILESWGITVAAFASGETFVESQIPPGRRPDVILVDLHLDGQMNGLDAIRTVRDRFSHTQLPAVLLTGDLSRDIEEQALSQRVSLAYKPLRPHRLKALLKQVSEQAALAEEAG